VPPGQRLGLRVTGFSQPNDDQTPAVSAGHEAGYRSTYQGDCDRPLRRRSGPLCACASSPLGSSDARRPDKQKDCRGHRRARFLSARSDHELDGDRVIGFRRFRSSRAAEPDDRSRGKQSSATAGASPNRDDRDVAEALVRLRAPRRQKRSPASTGQTSPNPSPGHWAPSAQMQSSYAAEGISGPVLTKRRFAGSAIQ
jgi:hypothetical protein